MSARETIPGSGKVVVLVALAPDDPDSEAYRQAIEGEARLRERIDLRFGKAEQLAEHLPVAEVVTCGNLSRDSKHEEDREDHCAFQVPHFHGHRHGIAARLAQGGGENLQDPKERSSFRNFGAGDSRPFGRACGLEHEVDYRGVHSFRTKKRLAQPAPAVQP